MKFLAHRGIWRQPAEQNQLSALCSAMAAGYGVETDFRDSASVLIVAHDPAGPVLLKAEEFFSSYQKFHTDVPLALNIKADGLRNFIKPLLEKYEIKNYFCFDMSVPETLTYRREGLRYFTRESEYEAAPVLYADAAGVWMDMFESNWIRPLHILRHLEVGKEVALVSPELHKRPYEKFWQLLRESAIWQHPGLMLCTDHPAEAREFFYA